MLLTEEEARTRRCQEGFGPPLSANGTPMMTAATAVYTAIQTAPQNCIASGCMAWRWVEPVYVECTTPHSVDPGGDWRQIEAKPGEYQRWRRLKTPGGGYCGKAGKP